MSGKAIINWAPFKDGAVVNHGVLVIPIEDFGSDNRKVVDAIKSKRPAITLRTYDDGADGRRPGRSGRAEEVRSVRAKGRARRS